MRTAFVSHPDCLRHDMGSHHPECPARLGAVEDHLIASGLMPGLDTHEAPLAQPPELERVHSAAYVASLAEASAQFSGVIDVQWAFFELAREVDDQARLPAARRRF
jgi:acetoin utilization deacetylase AcuC-like enzyme